MGLPSPWDGEVGECCISGWWATLPHQQEEEWAGWQREPAPEHTQNMSSSSWTSWKDLRTIWVFTVTDGSKAKEILSYPLLYFNPTLTSRMTWPRKSYFFKKECDNVIADGSYLELACSIINRYKEIQIYIYIYECTFIYTYVLWQCSCICKYICIYSYIHLFFLQKWQILPMNLMIAHVVDGDTIYWEGETRRRVRLDQWGAINMSSPQYVLIFRWKCQVGSGYTL